MVSELVESRMVEAASGFWLVLSAQGSHRVVHVCCETTAPPGRERQQEHTRKPLASWKAIFGTISFILITVLMMMECCLVHKVFLAHNYDNGEPCRVLSRGRFSSQ